MIGDRFATVGVCRTRQPRSLILGALVLSFARRRPGAPTLAVSTSLERGDLVPA
jgi:hypothetical protein